MPGVTCGAFIPPAVSAVRRARTVSGVSSGASTAFRGRCLRRARPAQCRRPVSIIVAVQTRPVSGDSDGEVGESPPPQKSYSVGVTIVSGCDAGLRRNVIERIAAESDVGRIVVVTTSGIVSTDEQDGKRIEGDGVDANGEVEMDKRLNGYAATPPGAGEETAAQAAVENLEGWISCSSPEEMAEVVVKLAASRECDYIIAEGSTDNSMEPQELAELLHARGGASLRVDSLVSVLDGDTLLQDLSANATSAASEQNVDGDVREEVRAETGPQAAMQDAADTRPMMVVSLVENANVIVVSRSADGGEIESSSQLANLLSVLNGSANILPVTNDIVPVDQLVNTNAYDHESVLLSATWKKVLIATRNAAKGITKPALPKVLKDSTFVYRARRPFHPTRLYQHIKAVATFNGVIRSTGRIWLATRMLAPLEWNQAGVAATLSLGKLFWAAAPENEWPTDEKEREKIMQDWDTQYGDRETEIVFVGIGIDKERLQGLLDGCLLQDEEMVFTNLWENFEDPFVEWVPLIEDDEDASEEENQKAVVEVEAADNASGNGEVLDEVFVTDNEPGLVSEGETGHLTQEDRNAAVQTDKEVLESLGEEELSGPRDLDGPVNSAALPDEIYEQASALDIFEQGFPEDSELSPQPQPANDWAFDEDEVVIASWDSADADAILTQVPRSGLPVTIVTGFLGSGKTTLLNYILTADHGLKIAVLVNEFGEIDIDNQLVEKGDWSSEDEVLELANGCICCSINDSFVNAVSKILDRKDRVDYLIVETTGVADPVPVINSLMVSDIAEDVRVDGILTVVDAENFDPKTNMGSEAALSQIMAADTILLSKTDLASDEKVEETIKYIRSVRPAARILRSQRGRVPINMILDVGVRVSDSPAHLSPVRELNGSENVSKDLTDDEAQGAGGSSEDSHAEDSHSHSRSHEHEHEHAQDHECGPGCTHESHSHDHNNHLETDGFVTTSFKSDAAFDPVLFMDKFLQRLPEGVFRAKGLLRFYGYGSRYIFQLSGRRYQFEEDEWPEGVAPGSQLVIIGRDLDLESLRQTLEACIADEGV